jgi:hypothetical protein
MYVSEARAFNLPPFCILILVVGRLVSRSLSCRDGSSTIRRTLLCLTRLLEGEVMPFISVTTAGKNAPRGAPQPPGVPGRGIEVGFGHLWPCGVAPRHGMGGRPSIAVFRTEMVTCLAARAADRAHVRR